ncbi:Crp/Fnr family transcriptional regulator [Spirosoma montaniterrae]|nr:Crp/Fnr family transcriptional regulator [Spirosoma montaniterrae]
MDTLRRSIESICPMPADFYDSLSKALVSQTLPRHTLLLRAGSVADKIYFIERGLVRGYWLDEGHEHTAWFMKEGDFVLSPVSFYTQSPSNEYIVLLEETILHSISRARLNELYDRYPAFNQIGRVLTETYYVQSEQRTGTLRLADAASKYAYFLRAYPGLINRVSLKLVASFLNISPETLSRLRAKRQ